MQLSPSRDTARPRWSPASNPALAAVLALAALALSAGCGDDSGGAPDAAPTSDAPSADAGTRAEVTFRVAAPANTPVGDTLYIAGDFQDWQPGSPEHALTASGDGTHAITLTFDPGTAIEFKFTRGDWGRVEKGPSGEEIPNRTLSITGSGVHEFTVDSWADLSPGDSTLTGDVSQITVEMFLEDRRVWVYLPPGYHDEPAMTYPVLYMFDGQNVFDEATSFAGEWGVDEACEDLIGNGLMQPIIVVAIDNGGAARIDEYTPWPDPVYMGGSGDEHLQAIVNVLVPHIDATYRTRTDPADTAIAGSSLGGLMALYAGYTHAAVFGRVAALSSSLWWDDEHLLGHIRSLTKPDSVIYTDMGTLESGEVVDEDSNGVDDSIDELRRLRDELVDQGFVLEDDLRVLEVDGAMHEEAAWAARFPDTLRFLFPPP